MKWDPSGSKIVISPGVTDASETKICLKLINVEGLQSNTTECFMFKLKISDKLKPVEIDKEMVEIVVKVKEIKEKVVEQQISI